MRIVDILSAPWAIVPEKLQEICAIYATHLRGEKIDLAALEAKLGQPLANEPQGYEVVDGVALLPIQGVIAKRMNLFSRISGGASTQLVERDFAAALADPAVQSILLLVDSPGGSVDGTQQLAQSIFAARGQKPITALADGMMASAAYWIGSAADQVFITGDTTQVGSIGVVAQHVDYSQAEAQRGVRVTEITAGKYKRVASEHAPLTREGLTAIEGMLDHIYGAFVNDVAMHRGTDAETVHRDMADGRLFIGQQAIKAGLVDGVATMPEMMRKLRRQKMPSAPMMGAVASNPTLKGNSDMETVMICGTGCKTQEEVDALLAALSEQNQAAVKDAATAERTRIHAVEQQSMPGHEALIAQLKADGTTSGAEAAVQVLAAEKQKLATINQNLKADATKPAPHAPAEGTKAQDKPEQDANKIAAEAGAYVKEQAKAGRQVSYAAAVAHVMQETK